MFVLLAISALFIPVLLRKKSRLVYEHLSTSAISEEHEYEIMSPRDLPDTEVDFYIVTYSIGNELFRLCRHSVTVPQRVKCKCTAELVQAIACDTNGQTQDVTELLYTYSGPRADFDCHEIPIITILQHHGIVDIVQVLTITRNKDLFSCFDPPLVLLHTQNSLKQLNTEL